MPARTFLKRLLLHSRPGDSEIGSAVTDAHPREGDYFSFKTIASPDGAQVSGRYAALKILEAGDTEFAFAVLDAIWDRPPTLRGARSAGILQRRAFKTASNAVVDHECYRSWWWAWRPHLLPEARFLGNDRISGLEREALQQAISYTGIVHAARSAEREWRWLHDREALLDEVKRSAAAHAAASAEKARQKRERLKTLTWDQLLAEDPFPGWGSGRQPVPHEALAMLARETVHSACRALKELGPKPRRRQVRPILRRCIDFFNDTDPSVGVIETEKRARILAVIEEMAELAGQQELIGEIDLWRGW